MGESTGSKRFNTPSSMPSQAASGPSSLSSNSSKPKLPLPVPQVLGVFILMAAILGLAAGALRHELVLTLLGAVLLAVWVYCLLTVLFLVFFHRKRAVSLAIRVVPEALGAGQSGVVFCSQERSDGDAGEGNSSGKERFFRLPGVLIRYALELATKDGRRLNHFFDPDFLETDSPFNAPHRGAYYGERDRFFVFDILGFFRAAITVPQGSGPRLLVMPQAAERAVPLAVQSGGVEQRTDPHFLRTDDLIDHRPYIPGDDPRRINWKLYGHAGDLFIREGEPEPPPHSRLVILIDTFTDPGLYTPEAGRRGVDLLCENALALALDYADRGMDVSIGFSGGGLSDGGACELAAVLAHPAAYPGESTACWELPLADEARGVLILALPREWTGGGVSSSARDIVQVSLDSFLKKRNPKQTIDMLFLYNGKDTLINKPNKPNNRLNDDRLEESAEACVRFYGGKGGVRARHIRL